MKISLVAVSCALTLLPGGVGGQETGTLSRDQALVLLRAVNSIQADAAREDKAYLELEDVLKSEVFQSPPLSALVSGMTTERSSAGVGAYSLAVVVDRTRHTYSVALIGRDRCAPGWFSDTAGVVYEGKAVGCSR